MLVSWLFGRRWTLWDIAMIIVMAATFDRLGWWNLLLCLPWAVVGQKGEAMAKEAPDAE